MNTKLLMSSSAMILGATGMTLSFFPHEIAGSLKMDGADTVILQLLGSLYFSYAMLNWTAKENLIGGIYSRPVAIGNFAHFGIGTLTLLKFAFRRTSLSIIWIAVFAYLIFAILFGYVLFTGPSIKNKSIKTL